MNILSKLLSPIAAVIISALLPLTAMAESSDSQHRHGYEQQSGLNQTYLTDPPSSHRGNAEH